MSQPPRFRQLGSRYRRVALLALPLLVIWLASTGGAWLLLSGSRGWGPALAVGVTVLLWWRQRAHDVAAQAAPQAVVILALGFAATSAARDPLTGLASAALVLAVLAAPMIERALRPALEGHRVPGLRLPPLSRVAHPVFDACCLGGLVLAAVVAWAIPDPIAFALVGVVLVLGAAVTAAQLQRTRRHLPEREVRAALSEYAPEYYVYFSGKPEAAYQLTMWLPYLERTGTRGALLIRERHFLATALRLTSLPVVLAESVEPIEHAIVPSLRAIFYVNNAAKNVDGVRYSAVTHVHLGHGDSDKPISYASSTTMFDLIFVAGQAGADRFASHGVLVPPEKFVLVGRPQVEAIQVRDAGGPLPQPPTVLYAPTWRGSLGDMQLSSLGSGEAIVSALLDAGANVIFRPHPFANRDAASRVLVTRIDALLAARPGSGNVPSEAATRMTIFECMNASDALVGDVSSVASDYLYSNKPIGLAHHSGDDLLAAYPLARGAYPLAVDEELATPVGELLGSDPKAADRAEVRAYYLGPWPAEGYSDVFVNAARDAIRTGRATSG